MYKVIKGKYVGKIGKVEACKNDSHVMFYPIEGKNPYRVCLRKEDVKEIEND
jgi:hypothetical protein